MLRRLNVPEYVQNEFNQNDFEMELKWLERAKEGKVISIITPNSLATIVGSGLTVAFLIGATLGAMIAVFIKSLTPIYYFPILAFFITIYFVNRPLATMYLDLENEDIQYEGVMMFAGDARSVRYRGPFQVIEGTELLLKNRKFFIRFITNSGYMRIPFKPEKFRAFYLRLEDLGIINLNDMINCLTTKEIIKKKGKWDILYTLKFERTEFKKQMKIDRELEQKSVEFERTERKRKLLEMSKERKVRENGDHSEEN